MTGPLRDAGSSGYCSSNRPLLGDSVKMLNTWTKLAHIETIVAAILHLAGGKSDT